jgi:hypothetical protein
MPDYDPTNPVSSIGGRTVDKKKTSFFITKAGLRTEYPKLLDQARDVMRRQTEKPNSPLFEIALVLVRLDYVA